MGWDDDGDVQVVVVVVMVVVIWVVMTEKSCTTEHIHNSYPQENWTHTYTDGSAKDAVRSSGAGVCLKYPGGNDKKISLAVGVFNQLQGRSRGHKERSTSPHGTQH